MKRRLLSAALLVSASSILGAQTILPPVTRVSEPAVAPPPGVDVWFDKSNYLTFDKASVFFAADPGAYVVVVRVTPRGTVDVLYPSSPAIQTPYKLNAEGRTELRFRNDGGVGVGEIAAIASATPFDLSRVADGTKWNSRKLSHLQGGVLGSYSSAFFAEILGSAGTRYGITSASYGVGMNGNSFAASYYGAPTAEESMRETSRACRVLGAQVSPDPDCAAAAMSRGDPKPARGRRSGPTASSPTPPPSN